ncbi:large subunit ribosomal protein L6 [Mycoplasma testudineum]|uniref:Large ribosomal subunit protein uL6 n=1 Tax=Mycoplasma testudineum TaxID=244584 RepID=A0A4R6IH44_9MOLU|nr:50S ribosomal protein L6 [Mycoplasma testudineum]OYD27158.1 50S ribosomal protein L6 [Mycoplasma testudineum]TDO21087.1 large subunit ribosomal protein L6 [Mycoplasma testudineum]
MSRVGKRIITIPQGVEFNLTKENFLTVKGPLGQLQFQFSDLIVIKNENNQVTTERVNELKHTKQLHGTTNALIANMVHGVSKGYEIKLIIEGVGYKAALKGQELEVAAGYSHLVNLTIPQGLTIEVPKPVNISVKGIDKQIVGQFAANIRKIRPASPYSGKGIRYEGEKVRRKEGKKASK